MACVFGIWHCSTQATGLTYGPIATEAVIIVTGLGIYACIHNNISLLCLSYKYTVMDMYNNCRTTYCTVHSFAEYVIDRRFGTYSI
jgi:hypothetical protein